MPTPFQTAGRSGARSARWLTFAGLALCALCCAAPMLAALGVGTALVSSLAGAFEMGGMVLFGTGVVWLALRAAKSAFEKRTRVSTIANAAPAAVDGCKDPSCGC